MSSLIALHFTGTHVFEMFVKSPSSEKLQVRKIDEDLETLRGFESANFQVMDVKARVRSF